MVGWIVLLCVAVAALTIVCIVQYRSAQSAAQNWSEQSNIITSQNKRLLAANEELKAKKAQTDSQISVLNQKLNGLEITNAELRTSNAALSSSNETLQSSNAALQISNTELRSSLADAVARNEGDDDVLARKREELERLNAAIGAANTALNELNIEIAGINEELQHYVQQLDKATDLDLGNELEGFEVTLNGPNRRTAELLESVIAQLNDKGVTQALRGYIWEKFYRPIFQDNLKAHRWFDDNLSGIYCLRLRSDPSVCYVGQAVGLKKRWYQHARKMLGLDWCGNEKLYNYGIEDFVWCVVETGLPAKALDEHEHYWIQFFRADSVGLNKKS